MIADQPTRIKSLDKTATVIADSDHFVYFYILEPGWMFIDGGHELHESVTT